MGEYKFNATRMSEVYNRLDEITEQLLKASNNDVNSLNSIAGNITGETVINTLKAYTEKTLEITKETQNLMNQMKEYLNGQLQKYTATEQQAKESLSDVQSILSQLEGGV